MMLLLLPSALAYETDQLTDRLVPLADAAPQANERVDQMLAVAVGRTNTITRCKGSRETIRRVLAYQVDTEMAHAEFVPDRGELAGLGYGAYAAWLETADIPRRTFKKGQDIYGDLKPMESVVLGTVGVCSTINLGGVLMGTDKPDHFWSQGYEYYVASLFGKRDRAAIRWGTASEKGQYGLLTSNVFSFADLYANWQGYGFYKSLLEPGSVLQQAEDGCVTQTRPWRWEEWLDHAADEVFNPPVYEEAVRDAVRERLEREKGEICSAWDQWHGQISDALIVREAQHVSSRAPRRTDEWGLQSMCGGAVTAGASR